MKRLRDLLLHICTNCHPERSVSRTLRDEEPKDPESFVLPMLLEPFTHRWCGGAQVFWLKRFGMYW